MLFELTDAEREALRMIGCVPADEWSDGEVAALRTARSKLAAAIEAAHLIELHWMVTGRAA